MAADNLKPSENGLENEDVARQSVNRRRFLGMTAGSGAAALAGAVFAQTLTAETAKAHSWLTLDIAPDLGTFDAIREPLEGDAFPLGPFYINGAIYPEGGLDEDGTPVEGAQSIGTFRCWGWIYDGSAETGESAVQQSFELIDVGEIQVQAGKDLGNKAITGGAGAFRGRSGEMIRTDINKDNFTFRASFTD